MSGLPLTIFGGVKPKIDSHLLPVQLAQSAQNCRITSGAIASWRKPVVVAALSKAGPIKSIYRVPYNGADYWLHWNTDVDIVPSQLANDAFNRYYFTGDGEPKVTNVLLATTGAGTGYPLASFTLGLPTPATPTISSISGGVSALTTTRSYFVTLVTAWNEEGPPSLPVIGSGKPDATWTIASLPTAQPSDGGTYQVVAKRIYRTVTASDGTSTDYLVAEVPLATSTYADVILDAALVGGTTMDTIGWIKPPSDLKGIISLPNGALAGFSGNQLCISEPYYPHAWPTANRYSVDFPIVGIAANGANIAVCTTANPYVFTGVNPDGMTPNKSKSIEPCLSKRSIVDVGWGVLYACPTGIANALTENATVVTSESILAKSWRENYRPSDGFAGMYEGRYFYFKDTGGGIIWAQNSDADGHAEIVDTYTESWIDPKTGLLYVVGADNTVSQWDADPVNCAQFDWKSKRFVEPKPLNYGAIQVSANYAAISTIATAASAATAATTANAALLTANNSGGTFGGAALGAVAWGGSNLTHIDPATAGGLTIYIYADGVLKFTGTFTSDAARKLPSGYKARDWEVRVVGNFDVYSIKIAENMKALERL